MENATSHGRELLKAFAELQVVPFRYAARRLDVDEDGLNGVLGHLTQRYRSIVNDESATFYILIEDTHAWAVSYDSLDALRRVFSSEG